MAICFLSLMVSLGLAHQAYAQANAPVEAKDNFENRQADLITLSGQLGTLHRLHQICAQAGNLAGNLDLFRGRMTELIALERPMTRTQRDMQSQFDENYRAASRLHLVCGEEALTALQREATTALIITERLYAPFRISE
ncbi:MAG: TIGR02301 family protein [Pseudomonadota bacterium]